MIYVKIKCFSFDLLHDANILPTGILFFDAICTLGQHDIKNECGNNDMICDK